MTSDRAEIRSAILETLGRIAPEADLATLDPRVDFREQLDVDSMDVLNFVIGVHERLGVEIPEADYPKVTTLDDFVAYVVDRIGTSPSGRA
ncbi:MAG: acyl carrier protein [Chloroflexota bacterium]